MALSKNESGQISIFFSASLMVLISIIAFVINVGLFVKAKINLQNAVDASAYAGAAVQARQLSKISYLNWEMRNVFKEWMYKYYVIGNLNINDVENPNGDGPMSFRLEKDVDVFDSTKTAEDPFNIPAVCIHVSTSDRAPNICKKYGVPALPEFGSSHLIGAEESSRVFQDALAKGKVDDCVTRSKLNMLVAITWAYNVLSSTGDITLAGQAPAILSDRQGAWPKAVEIAMRIRNLELAMNKAPSDQSVCRESSPNCGKSIDEFTSGGKELGNERIVKAFFSGYRNLGNGTDDEMKNTFTLTEIKPRGYTDTLDTSASNFLIPSDKKYTKYYVDLKLMMVNYAVFYAALISRAKTNDAGAITGTGACDVSKVAIPVPGYPLGFYKNPDVLTYYAVKGQANFVGMFNPFHSEPITLTAYAAAKPFGGRVGPMLFIQKDPSSFIQSRSGQYRKSVPYIASIKIEGSPIKNPMPNQGTTLGIGEYSPGAPLPINFASGTAPGPFWLQSPDSAIGGVVGSDEAIQFGLPNMVYDYQTPYTNDGYTVLSEKIYINESGVNTSIDKAVGLFSKNQFAKFKGTALKPGSPVSVDTLMQEVMRVRAPTSYEAANYLIPSPDEFNKNSNLDSFGQFAGSPQVVGDTSVYSGAIYAPLFRGSGSTDQADVLYDSANGVVSAIFEFMRLQKYGIFKYRASINKAAYTIYDMKRYLNANTQGTAAAYESAAKGVSDIDFSNPSNINMASPASCESLNGQFLYYYFGDPDTRGELDLPSNFDNSLCPRPLGTLLRDFFSGLAANGNFSPTHYRMELSWREAANSRKMLSAYAPGPLMGIGEDGTFRNPLAHNQSSSEVMRRNAYSTKFVTLKSLMEGDGQYAQSASNFPVFSEGPLSPIEPDITQKTFANPIDAVFNSELATIKH